MVYHDTGIVRFVKENLGKNVRFKFRGTIPKGHNGMIVGYNRSAVLVSFVDEAGWKFLPSDVQEYQGVMLIQFPLNVTFWHVHIEDFEIIKDK